MSIHLYPADGSDQHIDSQECRCRPFIDFQIQDAGTRQVSWVIRHTRMRREEPGK